MYLGVDGGGTKTAFCILDGSGRVLARTEGPTCYFLSVGLDEAERRVRDGTREVCLAAGVAPGDIVHAFYGLPAYGEVSSVIARLDRIPAEALGHTRYRCGNDTICGWAGSLGATDGINMVAGTGSITYGENRGRTARCGGWGELFSDEGSAYWIGRCALTAFSRMSDGRECRTALLDRLRDHLALGTELDLVDVVLNQWAGDRTRIAALAPVIDAAAEAGDPSAGTILDAAAEELALLVRTTRRALRFGPTERVALSYSGGVFRSARVLAGFRRSLGSDVFDFREPLYEPVVGAALYAARLVGTELVPQSN